MQRARQGALLREGIASFVRGEGIEVVAQAASPEELLAAVDEHEPDVAIVDIRMPPTQTDEGIQAAHEIRRRHPAMGIVLLSQHVEVGVATQLLAETPQHDGVRKLVSRLNAVYRAMRIKQTRMSESEVERLTHGGRPR